MKANGLLYADLTIGPKGCIGNLIRSNRDTHPARHFLLSSMCDSGSSLFQDQAHCPSVLKYGNDYPGAIGKCSSTQRVQSHHRISLSAKRETPAVDTFRI